MCNAVALLFLFVVVAFFNITFFLNLVHHFLIFDEFLIKPNIDRVSISKLSIFFPKKVWRVLLSQNREIRTSQPEKQAVTSL